MKHPMERVLLVLVAVAAIAAGHAHAAALWNADWYSSAPPTLNLYGPTSNSGLAGKPSSAVAFSAQGDILFGAMAVRAYDYQFMRIGIDGTQRWVANVYDDGTSPGGAYSLWPADDGGTLLALGASLDYGDSYDRLVKLGSNGAQLWSRAIPSAWTLPVATNRIASAGCSRLSLVDSTNGNVLWQRTLLARRDYCTSGGLVADAQANLYVLVAIADDSFNVTGFRAQKFDIDGHLLWDVATDAPNGASAAAVEGDALYVVTQQGLRVLHASDGSLAWTVPADAFAKVLLSDDPAHDPIIIESDQVRRVEAGTGQLLWATPLANTTKIARVVQGALLVATSDGRAKLDLATGAIAWNLSNDEDPDPFPIWLGFGEPANGSVLAVAQQPYTASTAPALVKRIDFASGAIVADVALPPAAQGIAGDAYADGGDDIVNVGISATASEPVLHLRRLDAATGALRWEVSDPIDDVAIAAHSPLPRIQVALATDTIAIVAPITQPACFGGTAVTGAARVTVYERATGMRRWRSVLADADQQCTYASAPHVDAQGNVFVSVAALIACPNGISCQRRTLYKLRAADGSVAWRKDESTDAGIEGFVLSPTEVTPFGTDIVFVGWIQDTPGSMHRLSGVDGSVQWSFDVAMGEAIGDQIDKLDEHHLIVHSGSNTNLT
jgi:hypothetical protein